MPLLPMVDPAERSAEAPTVTRRFTWDGERLARLALACGWAVWAVSLLSALHAPLEGRWGVWRASDTASIAWHFLHVDFDLLHPQVFWGGPPPGYVETELALHPWIVAALQALTGMGDIAGSCVSWFAMTTAVLLASQIAAEAVPQEQRWLARAAVIWTALSSAVLDGLAVAFMPEALCLAFYAGAILAFERWIRAPRRGTLAAAAGCLALAALVKPPALHLGLYMSLRALTAPGRPIRRSSLWVAWAAVLAIVAAFLAHAHGLYVESGRSFGVLGEPDSKFPRLVDLVNPRRWAALGATAVDAGLHVLALAALVAAVASRRHRGFVLPWAAATGLGLVTAMRYTTSAAGLHYHAFFMLLVAVAAGLALPEALRERKLRTLGALAVATPIAAGLRAAGPYGPDVVAGIEVVVAAAVAALLAREWRRPAMAVAIVALAAAHVHARQRTAAPGEVPEAALGERIAVLVPEGGLIVVRSPDVAWDAAWARSNNFQEPIVFYAARRPGWSLPADVAGVGLLEEAIRGGATLFVERADALEAHEEALAPWLEENARLVERGERHLLFRLLAPTDR